MIAKRDMPILGIEFEEYSEVRDKTTTSTKHYGPCEGCASLNWLSHKSDSQGWICETCWYGEDVTGDDPVVADVYKHLRGVWYEVHQTIKNREDDTLTFCVHEDVQHLICPQCSVETEELEVTVFDQLACPSCIEEAKEEVQG